MDRKEVFEKVQGVFRNTFKNESLLLEESMPINEIDGWTSLVHMMLVADLADVFSIKFRLNDLNNMKTVGDMLDTILNKLPA
jgi:acyl carrier protein